MKNPVSHRGKAPSLPLLFARYFVKTMVIVLALTGGFSLLLNKIYSDSDNQQFRRFMDGTVSLIIAQLAYKPPAEQHRLLQQLAKRFRYPLQIVTVPPELSLEQRNALKMPYTVYDNHSLMLYAPLPGQSTLLRLGPLHTESSLSPNSNLDDDVEIIALWLLFCGSSLGIIVYLCLRPIWHDVIKLRYAAQQFAQGELDIRVAELSSSLFKPLGQAFNGMATRLRRLVEIHQTLANVAAHELRTPIARLRFGIVMLESADNPSEYTNYRKGIERDITELEELVNTTIRYGKLNHGGIRLNLKDVNAEHWFAELIQSTLPLKPSELEVTLHCTPVQLHFDCHLMHIAIRNLLLNAFKYAKTRIVMQIELEQERLRIHVEDDGPGIPVVDRQHVFKPFHRLERQRDQTTGGYGLGLSFVSLIAEYHGGHASAHDSVLGGARFTVDIAR